MNRMSETQLLEAIARHLPEPPPGEARRLYELAVALFDACGPRHAGVLVRALEAAAKSGIADAWVDLGRCRWNGWGVPKDREAALADYLRAAEAGSSEGFYVAAHNLYWHFERYDEAQRWARKAVEAGDVEGRATYLLGLMAFSGRGCPKSMPDALAFHRAAAADGNPDAMFELYALYATGTGVERNEAEARRWCIRAAERGQARACYNLGALHATGSQGFPQDWAESVRWYERASDLGHAKASYNLGLMYLNGEGVDRDEDEARLFLRRAREQGHEVSPELLPYDA